MSWVYLAPKKTFLEQLYWHLAIKLYCKRLCTTGLAMHLWGRKALAKWSMYFAQRDSGPCSERPEVPLVVCSAAVDAEGEWMCCRVWYLRAGWGSCSACWRDAWRWTRRRAACSSSTCATRLRSCTPAGRSPFMMCWGEWCAEVSLMHWSKSDILRQVRWAEVSLTYWGKSDVLRWVMCWGESDMLRQVWCAEVSDVLRWVTCWGKSDMLRQVWCAEVSLMCWGESEASLMCCWGESDMLQRWVWHAEVKLMHWGESDMPR